MARKARKKIERSKVNFPIVSAVGVETKMNMAQTNLSKLVAVASWSAPALWRFGRRETVGPKSGRGLPQSKTLRSF
jgi:hypothetical protein